MAIKVFHEAPLSIMPFVSEFTDGEYCLPHLLDSNEGYREYFEQAKLNNRYIIMDNSLHELGYPYSNERLIYWVNKLKPDEFIVPDVLGNPSTTLNLVNDWVNIEFESYNTIKVAVIQAQFEEDFRILYEEYKELGYKKICIPYGLEVYQKIFPHPNKYVARTYGRIKVIMDLLDKGVIKDEDKIHLLGCNLPNEFVYYKNTPQIESIDTSNPVMAALDGNSYSYWEYGNLGLDSKPKCNINNSFTLPRFSIDLDLVESNIDLFKQMNKL